MLPLCSQIGREEITIFSGLFVVQSYLQKDACQAVPGLWLVCRPFAMGQIQIQVPLIRHVLWQDPDCVQ